MRASLSIAFVTLVFGAPALAGKLPSSAVPLSAEEVTKMHSGMTGIYPTVEQYYGPDGATQGVVGRPAVKSTFSGRWVVHGNTICTLNSGKLDSRVYTDCNAFWKDGDKIFLLWSTRFDGGKIDLVNGYYDLGNALKPGNIVADKYKAAGGL